MATKKTRSDEAQQEPAKPTIPQLIQRYNDASARQDAAKREAEACKAPLKAFAEEFGISTKPTEKRAEQIIDGFTCIVYLGLANSFDPDVKKVVDLFGLAACLEAGLLSVNVKPLRELAAARQIKMEALGDTQPATPKMGKCEAIPVALPVAAKRKKG